MEITYEILAKALNHMKEMPIYREGPRIFSSGKQLNLFLDTKKYDTTKVYAGTCIADMKIVGDYYAFVRLAKKSGRRKQKS
jgi:orotate phosphoribosyltransferase